MKLSNVTTACGDILTENCEIGRQNRINSLVSECSELSKGSFQILI